MTVKIQNREYTVSKTDKGYFVLTSRRGAAYVACQAFIGDDDTMKFVGGLRSYNILRNKSGHELHLNRRQLEEFAA